MEDGTVALAEEDVKEESGKTWMQYFEGAYEGWQLISGGISAQMTVPDNAREQGIINRMAFVRENTKAALLDMSAPMRHKFSNTVRDMITAGIVADPDMWDFVKNWLTQIARQIWQDIEHEVESSIEASMLRQKKEDDAQGPTGCIYRYSGYAWLRAKVLHHYLPHNKSFFGKVKDPVYLVILLLTLLPIHGLRVGIFAIILFFILCPCPADEFQLMNYILLFKGTQFITGGFLSMLAASLQNFWCFTLFKDSLMECVNTYGPGAGDPRGALLDYIGNAVLVWFAFLFLPFSKRFSAQAVIRDKQKDDFYSCKCCCFSAKLNDGRMFKLLWHDFKSFMLSAAILAALSYFTCKADFENGDPSGILWWQDPQFRQNLFWCKVFYSFCSAPFLPYSVPALLVLLTHSTPTGYNEHGAAVGYHYPSVVDEQDEQFPGTITDQAAQITIEDGVQKVKDAGMKAGFARLRSMLVGSKEHVRRSMQERSTNAPMQSRSAASGANAPLLSEADSSGV